MKKIKVGDKFTGFKFKHKIIYYNSHMDNYIGMTGIVNQVLEDRVLVRFPGSIHWAYPILKSKFKNKLK